MGKGGLLSKSQLPLTGNQWARTFTDGGRGPIYRNSTVSSDSHLKIGHFSPDSVILIVLSAVNL